MDTRSMRPYALAVSLLVAAVATPLPAATYPSWWMTRGVVDTNAAPSDYSPANLGQLKWFATNACDELEEHLPGGAGADLRSMVTNFSKTGNAVPINLGQLKFVASNVYARLIEEGYTNSPPWTTNTTADDADFAIANLGQLKHVFSFDLLADTDEDDLPDWIEWAIVNADTNDAYATLADVLPEDDFDGDGYLNIYEAVHVSDPTDAASKPAPAWYVDGAVASSGDGKTLATAFKTIQEGLDAATNDYDVVMVASGTYSGIGNTNLHSRPARATLISASGPMGCIIDCCNSGRGFYLASNETPATVICGFTVRNGNVPDDGGAIYCSGASPTIRDCVLENNTARYGGGLAFGYCSVATGRVHNCVIAGNHAHGTGSGGGIDCVASALEVLHCTVVDNTASNSAQCAGGLGLYAESVVTIRNCIIWGNTEPQIYELASTGTVSYCDVEGGWPGDGNFSSDPMLWGQGYWLAAESPCVDAAQFGEPALDHERESRFDVTNRYEPWGCIADIGADEYRDTDHDGAIDAWERINGTDPDDPDSDQDGAQDGLEFSVGTDPLDDSSFPVSISGNVAYSGVQTGTIHVVAVAQSNDWGLTSSVAIDEPGSYTIPYVPNGTSYWVKAWCDANGSATNDYWEAWGRYAATSIIVNTSVGNVDISLSDPTTDMDEDAFADWWECFYLGNLALDGRDDPDADGFLNDYEYRYGSLPNDRSSVPAGTRFVSLSGSHSAPYTNWAAAATNLQAALAAATNAYEVILVDTGTYTTVGNTDLVFPTNPVTLAAADYWHDGVVIDCNTNARAFIFTQGQDWRTVVGGFTVKGGRAQTGGAVLVLSNAAPTLASCTLRANVADDAGGAVRVEGGGLTLLNCRIENNVCATNATAGAGGIDASNATVRLVNVIMTANTGQTGAIRTDGASDILRLDNCSILDNHAGNAAFGVGGVACASTNAVIRNTILWDNTALDLAVTPAGIVSYSFVANWTNKTSGVSAYPGEGNMYVPPNVGMTPGCRLRVGGYCVGAGATNVTYWDWDGEPRDEHPDIGADELVDRDSDHMADAWERYYGLDPEDGGDWSSDADGDKRRALQEFYEGTDPTRFDRQGIDSDDDGVPDDDDPDPSDPDMPSNPGTDTDGDGMPDWWENLNGLDSGDASDASSDTDSDGLYAFLEWQICTDPSQDDMDGDGALDGAEFFAGTDYFNEEDYPDSKEEDYEYGEDPGEETWDIKVNVPKPFLLVNDNDDDADGVVDKDDGFDADSTPHTPDDINEKEAFMPIVIELDSRFKPLAYKGQITGGAGLRLWRKDGPSRRKNAVSGNDESGGSLIPTDERPLWDLGMRGNTILLYAEGISPGANTVRLEVTKRYDGDSWQDLGTSGTYEQYGQASLTIIKVDMTKPAANDKFTFDAASPGKLEVECEVTIQPDTAETRALLGGEIILSIDAIGRSILSWDHADGVAAYQNGAFRNRATFRTLPANNTDFGGKSVRLNAAGSGFGGSERSIKVFYSAYAKNHPEGNASDPNYFHYYMQTTARAGSPLYGAQGSVTSLFPPYTSYVEIESEPLGKKIGSPGANADQDLMHIDLFAWACRHEKSHQDDYESWWGAAGHRWPRELETDDTDVDWMPDSIEPYLPETAGGPYSAGTADSYPDDSYEDQMPDSERHACMSAEVWQRGSANEDDWACPGNQWP